MALTMAGCATASREANTNQNANSNTNATSASTPAETKPAADTGGMDSPTATMTTFVEALKKKDIATIKKTLSKSSVTKLEESAKAGNTTVEAILMEGEDMSNEKMPQMKNEKIDGDTATLDIEDDKTKKWDTVPFVKEDGVWKIAFDKIKT